MSKIELINVTKIYGEPKRKGALPEGKKAIDDVTMVIGHGNPLQYPCLENPHGQRSLAGYRPWGRRKSDMTEATEHTCMFAKM